MSQELVDAAQTFMDRVWNQHDMSAVDEFLTDNSVHHDPTSDIVGRSAYKAFAGQFIAAFPDLQGTWGPIAVDGDLVKLTVDFAGTHQGELMGVPPSGRQVRVRVNLTIRSENGQMVESWAEWDPQDMMRQIGA